MLWRCHRFPIGSPMGKSIVASHWLTITNYNKLSQIYINHDGNQPDIYGDVTPNLKYYEILEGSQRISSTLPPFSHSNTLRRRRRLWSVVPTPHRRQKWLRKLMASWHFMIIPVLYIYRERERELEPECNFLAFCQLRHCKCQPCSYMNPSQKHPRGWAECIQDHHVVQIGARLHHQNSQKTTEWKQKPLKNHRRTSRTFRTPRSVAKLVINLLTNKWTPAMKTLLKCSGYMMTNHDSCGSKKSGNQRK